MESRCREVMKLADETYKHYKSYGKTVKDSVVNSLKFQRKFVENDVLLSGEEKEDMRLYITTYIVDIYLDKYLQHD